MKRLVTFTQLNGKRVALVIDRIVRVETVDDDKVVKVSYLVGSKHMDFVLVKGPFYDIIQTINLASVSNDK